jgi:hypothetical protein
MYANINETSPFAQIIYTKKNNFKKYIARHL